jgi:hypothetical protein
MYHGTDWWRSTVMVHLIEGVRWEGIEAVADLLKNVEWDLCY